MRGVVSKTYKNKTGGTKSAKQAAAQLKIQRSPAHLWWLVALWALVLASYSNSFKADFLLDNEPAILQDVRVHAATPQNINRILNEGYWFHRPNSGLYRPVTTFSYLLNYAVLGNGTNPMGYHWLNLGLHGLNVTLVYVLGLLVLEEATLAFWLAAVWGVHPLATESVTNIVGRADLLAAFFVLAGFLCHVKASTSQAKYAKVFWLVVLVICQTLGLFSKENALVLPAIMLLYDLTWRERATWRQRAASYSALAVPFIAFFLVRYQVHTQLRIPAIDNPMVDANFITARMTAIKVIGKFLSLVLWPARLSPEYSYNAIPVFSWQLTKWENVQAILALGICIGTLWAAIRWYRTQRSLFFLLLFAIIVFSPTSNLVVLVGSIMAERFAYLPAIGVLGCGVIAIHMTAQHLFRREGAAWAGWITVAVVLTAFGLRTYERNFDWYDAETLWRTTLAAYPNSAKAHLNLGNALWKMHDTNGALAEYQAAAWIAPDYGEAHTNLGAALTRTSGRLPDAITEYQIALRLLPDSFDAHNNLGSVLSRIPGRQQDAVTEFRTALRIDPNSADAHTNIGSVLSQMPGGLPEAIREFEAALRIDPDLVSAHRGLGSAWAQTAGGLKRAVEEFEIVLQKTPNDAGAHNDLGNALAQIPGRTPDAILQWKLALQLDPTSGRPHYNLGLVLAEMPDRKEEAIRELEAAFQWNPDPRVQQIIDRLKAKR
jgi:tetratricopeptide (TPR) repeat protein